MDLEIIWDGSHHGEDGDLLCAVRVPVKRMAAPEDPPPSPRRSFYPQRDGSPVAEAVIACLRVAPATQRAVMAATGFTRKSVSNAVCRLQRAGRVQVVPEGGSRFAPRGAAYQLRGEA